jgi:sulfofructose kinase
MPFKQDKVRIRISDGRQPPPANPPLPRPPKSQEKRRQAPAIAGAGIACLDYIFASRRPAWGETASVESTLVQGGGLVGTALVACARLGAKCRLYSFLSHDETGSAIAAELAREGIRLDGVVSLPGGSSPSSFIHVDTQSGERTIFHRPAMGVESAKLPDLGAIAGCQAVLVDDYYPELALAASRTAREHGVPVVADVSVNPLRAGDYIRNVTVLIAPVSVAGRLRNGDDLAAALEAFRSLGPQIVVFTLGPDGWAFAGPSGQGRGRAFAVQVKDTTGAGDAFHGAFAYGIACGWEVGRCAEFAGAVAAIKCTMPGGRDGLPTLAATMDFLRKRGRLDWSGYGA